MLLTMFRSERSASNGDLHSINDISFSESAVPHVCLGCDTSLCCSLVCYVTDVSCCIALFTLSAGTSWQIPNKSLGFCHASPSRKTITRLQAPRQYLFDNKVCGQLCPKSVPPPDNMHSLGELPVNIGIRVFQLVTYFSYTYCNKMICCQLC